MKYEIELDNEFKTNNFELIHNESDHTDLKTTLLTSAYNNFINKLKTAEDKATLVTTRKINEKTLPKYLVDLIKIKSFIEKKIFKIKKKLKNNNLAVNTLVSY